MSSAYSVAISVSYYSFIMLHSMASIAGGVGDHGGQMQWTSKQNLPYIILAADIWLCSSSPPPPPQ